MRFSPSRSLSPPSRHSTRILSRFAFEQHRGRYSEKNPCRSAVRPTGQLILDTTTRTHYAACIAKLRNGGDTDSYGGVDPHEVSRYDSLLPMSPTNIRLYQL